MERHWGWPERRNHYCGKRDREQVIHSRLPSSFPTLLAAQSRPPDLIVTNAIIYTADSADPRAEALAVSGDRLVFVGSTAGATALAGPATNGSMPEGARSIRASSMPTPISGT